MYAYLILHEGTGVVAAHAEVPALLNSDVRYRPHYCREVVFDVIAHPFDTYLPNGDAARGSIVPVITISFACPAARPAVEYVQAYVDDLITSFGKQQYIACTVRAGIVQGGGQSASCLIADITMSVEGTDLWWIITHIVRSFSMAREFLAPYVPGTLGTMAPPGVTSSRYVNSYVRYVNEVLAGTRPQCTTLCCGLDQYVMTNRQSDTF